MSVISRHYTTAGIDPYAGVTFRSVQGDNWLDYIVPAHWSAAAVDQLLEGVFYRHALPALTVRGAQDPRQSKLPPWLIPMRIDGSGLDNISAEWRYRFEKDIRDVLNRVAGGMAYELMTQGVLASAEEAEVFYDEARYLMIHQMVMPEIAALAVTGLDWAYGVTAAPAYVPAQRVSGLAAAENSSAPAAIAVGIDEPREKILDHLDLIARKRQLHSEARTAVVLPVENIDSAAFAAVPRQQEIDGVAQALGRRVMQQALRHVMDACNRDSIFGFDPARNPALARAAAEARASGLGDAAIDMAIAYARQGHEDVPLPAGACGEEPQPCALLPVLSVPDSFVESALTGHGFMLREGGENKRHINATRLWEHIGDSIWASGAPQVFFRDSALLAMPVLAEAGVVTGRSASGGYVFAADTQAPGGAVNLLSFMTPEGVTDTQRLGHGVQVLTLMLEALSGAQASFGRPLAISMTNISACLMTQGVAYDSEAGRNLSALLAAFVSGAAFHASGQLAARAGAFSRDAQLQKAALQGVKNRMAALNGASPAAFKGVMRRPAALVAGACVDTGLPAAVKAQFDRAYDLARESGLRHAHLTLIDTPPALNSLLDARTRDILPEVNLVRFEGFAATAENDRALYGKKLNPAVPRALKRLGYSAAQIDDIHFYAVGHGTLFDAPAINHASLRARGFHQGALDALESALGSAQHIRYVFNKWTLGEDFCRHMLNLDAEDLERGTFDMLQALGFDEDDIEAANVYCCGTMGLEGAPHLLPQHLAVFDCLQPAGAGGIRRVEPLAQVRMQAAVEPFLSGAVAQTVELDHHIDIDDLQALLLKGWELGVKNLSLYRMGCSLLHAAIPFAPPSGGTDSAEEGQPSTRPLARLAAKTVS